MERSWSLVFDIDHPSLRWSIVSFSGTDSHTKPGTFAPSPAFVLVFRQQVLSSTSFGTYPVQLGTQSRSEALHRFCPTMTSWTSDWGRDPTCSTRTQNHSSRRIPSRGWTRSVQNARERNARLCKRRFFAKRASSRLEFRSREVSEEAKKKHRPDHPRNDRKEAFFRRTSTYPVRRCSCICPSLFLVALRRTRKFPLVFHGTRRTNRRTHRSITERDGGAHGVRKRFGIRNRTRMRAPSEDQEKVRRWFGSFSFVSFLIRFDSCV